jgi:hypothetical protein
MRLSDINQLLRDRVRHAMRDVMRRMGLVSETRCSVAPKTRHPLVAGLLTDPKFGAELGHGLPTLQHTMNKLEAL